MNEPREQSPISSNDGRIIDADFVSDDRDHTKIRYASTSIKIAIILSLILSILLLILLIPGVLGRPTVDAVVERSVQTELRVSMEAEIAAYESMLAEGICRYTPEHSDTMIRPEIRPTFEQNNSSTTEQTEDQDDISLPIDPARTLVPPSGDFTDSGESLLIELLDKSAVLILVESGGLGSGFFVNDNTVLTNAHVVGENPYTKSILVGNKSMGGFSFARVMAITSVNNEIGEADFALLTIENSVAPDTLIFTTKISRLQNVIAIGYPGSVMSSSTDFQEMLQQINSGTVDANIPDSVFTTGRVMVTQDNRQGIDLILHRASISPGNSGGPLVDECGRVVGLNTFVRAEDDTGSDRIFYAIKSNDVMNFLDSNNIAYAASAGSCSTTTDRETNVDTNSSENQ